MAKPHILTWERKGSEGVNEDGSQWRSLTMALVPVAVYPWHGEWWRWYWRRVTRWQGCDVYWGSHGCHKRRGHRGDCWCDCCECAHHPDRDSGCVAGPPYYGEDTTFYGEDVEARGLPRRVTPA